MLLSGRKTPHNFGESRGAQKAAKGPALCGLQKIRHPSAASLTLSPSPPLQTTPDFVDYPKQPPLSCSTLTVNLVNLVYSLLRPPPFNDFGGHTTDLGLS